MIRNLRWLTVVLILSVGMLLMAPAGVARGETVEGLGEPTGYVNDLAGVLSHETLDSVSELCDRLDRRAHAQIVVVTLKTIDPDKSGATPSIEEFTTALEEKWKVGKKGTDRGILIVLVMNPRRGRIEVGYGLEGVLNDAKAGDIGREMAPYAQKNDYDDAVTLGVREISGIIATDAGVTLGADEDSAAHQYHRVPEKPMPVLLKLLIGGGVLVVFLILVATGHAGMAFWFLFNMIGMGRGGGGDEEGGGGGGFGGGGGGSSGGGGASGDF